MPLNEGEEQSLLRQVTVFVDSTEKKIRNLGLPHIKVGLFDERTRQPITELQELIDMANGKVSPAAAAALREQEELRLRQEHARKLMQDTPPL